jgi:hypothetical protein
VGQRVPALPFFNRNAVPTPKSPFGVYVVETNVRAWKTGSQIDAEQRFSVATAFPKTHWNWVVLMDSDQETDTYSQLGDERLHYFYGAIYMWPAIGVQTPPRVPRRSRYQRSCSGETKSLETNAP